MTVSICITEAPHHRRAKAPSLRAYLTVWTQRRDLASLDSARLDDLGITPAQAAKEAARPFWDLPCAQQF